MLPSPSGALRLFRFAGIAVFLHWSWFLVAFYQLGSRDGGYSSQAWNAAEYLALFGIVLLHEFGHSLACRSVGGRSEQIILWPLGGVAFVQPPERPGAQLWSIAAGPLVNVVLLLVLQVLDAVSRSQGWAWSAPDLARLINAVWWINTGLLVFNLLPVYPLDGGQILRSLLWYLVGPARSLLVASTLGLVGAAGLAVAAFTFFRSNVLWTILLLGFLVVNCWGAFKRARALLALERAPRRPGHACPHCHQAPPTAPHWACARCRRPFDAFATEGACPFCHTPTDPVACPHCGTAHPLAGWRG
jgi:Zn-dependent protease